MSLYLREGESPAIKVAAVDGVPVVARETPPFRESRPSRDDPRSRDRPGADDDAAAAGGGRTKNPKRRPSLQMNPLQSKFIDDTMRELREGESEKRRRIGSGARGSVARFDPRARVSFSDDGNNGGDGGDGFDILDELDEHPDAIQIVATSGGLITNWNEAFTKITRPSASLERMPLTIFELVDSKSLPSLYSMLALSLHNVGIVEVEDFSLEGNNEGSRRGREKGRGPASAEVTASESDETPRRPRSPSSHLSVTLPCVSFRNSSTRYDITVVFMNDVPSMKRCFLGILVPRAAEARLRDNADDFSLGGTSCGGSRASSLTSRESATKEPNAGEGHARDVAAISEASRRLPRGRILRVDDRLLCRLLLGPRR